LSGSRVDLNCMLVASLVGRTGFFRCQSCSRRSRDTSATPALIMYSERALHAPPRTSFDVGFPVTPWLCSWRSLRIRSLQKLPAVQRSSPPETQSVCIRGLMHTWPHFWMHTALQTAAGGPQRKHSGATTRLSQPPKLLDIETPACSRTTVISFLSSVMMM
jgi:hypothetical protein